MTNPLLGAQVLTKSSEKEARVNKSVISQEETKPST